MEKLKNKDLKIADYMRKSSRDGERQVLSLDGQTDAIQKARNTYKLPERICSYKESKSAKTAGKRPLYSEMLENIVCGKVNCILAWHLNRIARNMTEGGLLIDLISERKLTIITVCDGNIEIWDDSSDMSVIAQKFGASTEYSLSLSKDVKRGQRDKARKMGLPSGLATIGYKNSKQGEKGERWWFVDEERSWKVKKLFEMFLTGRYSIGQITEYAREELKLTTPSHKKLGGKLVTREYVGKMLHNPVFAGFFFVQGERYELDSNLPRVITEKEFNKIQQMLAYRNKNYNFSKAQKHQMTYSGFIFSEREYMLSQDAKYQIWCDCGHKFAYRQKTKCPKCDKKIDNFTNPRYFIQSYYYDNRKKKAKLAYKSVSEEIVEKEIIKYAEENFVFPTPLLDWAKKYVHEIADKEIKEGLLKSTDKEKRQIQYDDKKKKVMKLFIEDKISEEDRNTYLSDLENEYSDLKETSIPKVDWLAKLNEITDLTTSFKEIIQKGDIKAKREVLSALGSHIVWDSKNLFIYNKKSVETVFKGLKMIKGYFEGFGNEKTLMDKGFSRQNEEFCISLRKW